MIKKKGRLLLGALCICSVVVSYTPMYANAQENVDGTSEESVDENYSEDLLLAEYTSGDYTYTMGDGGAVITEYNGTASDVVIPATLDGKPVVKIRSAFYDNDQLRSVVIPDTVETIDMMAFENCDNLSKVTLGNNVSTLDTGCFKNCDSLESIVIPKSMTMPSSRTGVAAPFSGCDSLRTITIEGGGVEIPMLLCSDCKALTSITIPDGIKEIGDYAFSDCTSLREVNFPNSIETIESYAFSGCKKLDNVKLGTNIKEIEQSAFKSCESLRNFYNYSVDTNYGTYMVYSIFDNSPYVTIHGFSGSKSQEYAEKYNIPFVALPDNPMYRMYNKNSGEHFYTSSAAERNNLVSVGWAYESVAWIAPESSTTPVYRLYNPNTGDHHYTTNASEKDMLVSVGWSDEGIGWYSPASGTPLLRLYNPNATGAGSHHYTTDAGEKDYLVTVGWNYEGIAWYGM